MNYLLELCKEEREKHSNFDSFWRIYNKIYTMVFEFSYTHNKTYNEKGECIFVK